MDQELKGHQDSRAAAKVDLKKAANLRAKESEEYVRPARRSWAETAAFPVKEPVAVTGWMRALTSDDDTYDGRT